MRSRAVLLAVVVALMATMFPGTSVSASTDSTLYFHSPNQANVDQAAATELGTSRNFMSADAPTKSTASTALLHLGGADVVPAFSTDFSGVLTGSATVNFWASSQSGSSVYLWLRADALDVQKVEIPVPRGGPTQVTATFTNLNLPVYESLAVTFNAHNSLNNTTVGRGEAELYFDSVDKPSRFTFSSNALPAGGGTNPPGFANYASPINSAGYIFISGGLEASIGVDPRTNAVMVQNGFATERLTFDESQSPARGTWRNVAPPQTKVDSLDPILWTDRTTGRTFVAQLLPETSVLAFTDDDGASWTTGQLPSSAPAFDHETVGAGPWSTSAALPPLAKPSAYPHATYYCAQGVIEASCARSDDGGLTWGPPVPFNAGHVPIVAPDCGGIHGHVAVGPDGTVYVPQKSCNGTQGMWISHDNGLTWMQKRVAGSDVGLSDPKITFDAAGKVYFVGTGGPSTSHKPFVSTSTNSGEDWSAPVNIAPGIENAEQAAIVAGDGGRAAAFFYGSTTSGDTQKASWPGVWDAYVSYTYDGGATWTLVDATPSSIVQRGWMCLGGTGCSSGRNLLDFQDMTIDNHGRVLVAYADGCTGTCESSTGTAADSTDNLLTVARQTTGNGLYAAFDPLG